MSERCAPRSKARAALVLVFAACCAALIAHVGIDMAGDVLLPHDTYDALDHRSRSDVLAIGVTLALGALLRIMRSAVREAHSGRQAPRAGFDEVFGRGPWRFVCLVVALTLAAVAGMEAFDIACSGRAIDDAADLFGGSLSLGLRIAIPAAVLAAFGVRYLARLLSASQHCLAVALGRLIALTTRAGKTAQRRSERDGTGTVRRCRSILARRSAKRGPPLVVS